MGIRGGGQGAIVVKWPLTISHDEVATKNVRSSVLTCVLSFHSRKEDEVPSKP